MFDDLKIRIMKKVSIRILVSVVLCILIVVINRDGFMNLYQGPRNFFTLSEDELEGAYVEGNFNMIYDNFCNYYEENEDGETRNTKRYYIIPYGEEQYIAMKITPKYDNIADQIVYESYEYLMGNQSELSKELSVKGTIHKMEYSVRQYYKDWFEAAGFDVSNGADFEKYALAYVLDVDYIGDSEGVVTYLLFVLCGLLLVFLIIILVRVISGSYLSAIKKYMKKSEDRYIYERLEEDYMSGEKICKGVFGKNFTFYFEGCKVKIIPNDDILWAYQETITHRYYFVKVGVSRYLHLKTKKGKDHKITMQKADQINSVIMVYSSLHNNMLLGFGEDNKKRYKELVAQYKKGKFNKEVDSFHQEYNKAQ